MFFELCPQSPADCLSATVPLPPPLHLPCQRFRGGGVGPGDALGLRKKLAQVFGGNVC